MSFVASFVTSPGTSSTPGSAFNILCTVVGTGLLQLPYGGAQSGWLGVGLLVLLCLMALYTADIIVKCLALMKNAGTCGGDPRLLTAHQAHQVAPPRTYGDIGEAAFGQVGKWAVIVQMHLTLTMVATIYNLLAGLNLVTMLGWANIEISTTAAILIVAGVVWFHVFLKTLSEVAVVSSFNMLITLALEVVVITVALTHPPEEPPQTVLVKKDLQSFGGAFASFAFAYGVHPILPAIYRNMRNPQKYRMMIVWSFLGVLTLYLPMLIVGYAVYGDAVTSPIYQVPSMKDNFVVKLIIGALTLHVLGAYAIVINPPERALESTLGVDSWPAPLLWRMVFRTLFVALTAGVSITLQTKFPPFLDLVAAFTSTFTQFIFPSLFYLRLCMMNKVRVHPVEWLWNGLILIVATVGATFGTIDALKEIAKI